jgi:hypothetical protein
MKSNRSIYLTTIESGHISHWARMRRIFGDRRSSAPLLQYQSSVGCITNMSGFSF